MSTKLEKCLIKAVEMYLSKEHGLPMDAVDEKEVVDVIQQSASDILDIIDETGPDDDSPSS